jgi:hypothetical protein
METSHKIFNNCRFINGLAISTLVLVVCFASRPAAAQDQATPNSVTAQPQDAQPQQDSQQSTQMQPVPEAQPAPEAQSAPEAQRAPQRMAPQYMPPAGQYVPANLTLQAGTMIPVRVTEWLSSDKNHPGDIFNGTLEQPLIANGWVVAQRGQSVTGRVAVAQKAGRVSGVSQLGVELSELTLVDGQLLPVRTQLLKSSAGTSNGRDAAGVVTTTGVGAAIGAAADGGPGAAIGAGAGAVAGVIGVLTTRGRPTVIPPEALLSFRLEEPLNISTEQSQVAFQPVRPSDYRGDQDAYANGPVHRYVAGPGYPPPPYYYPAPWYGYGYYPGFAFGYYGFYGPGYYGGFRGGFRGGYRR